MFRKKSNNYVGYGSVAHSVIESRKQRRHLILKVSTVLFVVTVTFASFGFGGYKAIDYIQRSQTKVAKASPIEEYSGSYTSNSSKDKDVKPAWQRGTVTRVPKPESASDDLDAKDQKNAGIMGVPCEEAPKYPDETCTGTPKGIEFTKAKGLTITENDTVINAQEITGGIIIRANSVTIKNSVIRGDGTGNAITIESGTLKLLDSELSGFENGIVGDNWRAYRTNIHSMSGNAIKLGNYATIEDSWIHNLKPKAGLVAAGIRVDAGIINSIIRHNRIDLTAEPNVIAAIYIAPDFGPTSKGPLQIENNLLGGGTITLQFLSGNAGKYAIQNTTITDNRFVKSTGVLPVKVTAPVVQTGNVWTDNGSEVTF